jgi:hypothetical protein
VSNEEYVRSKRNWVFPYSGKRKSSLSIGEGVEFVGATKDGMDALWAAAAEFTRNREREIAELEEEIAFMQIAIKYQNAACGEEGCGCEEPFKRIIARLESALADLRNGMKP